MATETLTAEAIRAMEAGRAIDVLLAKSFGWKLISEGNCGFPPNGHGEYRVPNYSEDMRAAWQAVEFVLHLRWDREDPRHRGGMTDCIVAYNPYEAEWGCTFNWSDNKPVTADAPTAPLAICRAALLSML